MRTKNIVKAFEMLLYMLEDQKLGSRMKALQRLREENYPIYCLVTSATIDSRIREETEKIEDWMNKQ